MYIQAILLNDTRRDVGHIGCATVIQNIVQSAARCHIRIIKSYQEVDTKSDPNFISFCQQADIVLVNGEGTMHSDQRSAQKVMRSCVEAKKYDCRLYLINTVWAKNTLLNQFLPMFEKIYTRESYSKNAVLPYNTAVEVVPDMSFYSGLQSLAPLKTHILTIDSVIPETSRSLFQMSKKHRFLFRTMHPKRTYRRGILRFFSKKHTLLTQACIENAAMVFSGRFHAMCFCLMYEIPFKMMRSNSYKVEGTLHDIGLDLDQYMIVVDDLFRIDKHITGSISQQDIGKIRKYIVSAQEKIDSMFAEIAR